MYLDPGFGGMLLQVIILLVAFGGGVLFFIRKKIRNIFFRSNDAENTSIPTAISEMSDEDEDVVDMLEESDN